MALRVSAVGAPWAQTAQPVLQLVVLQRQVEVVEIASAVDTVAEPVVKKTGHLLGKNLAMLLLRSPPQDHDLVWVRLVHQIHICAYVLGKEYQFGMTVSPQVLQNLHKD